MSNTLLIVGESGAGKSTSFRNLNAEETFIINIVNKPLPFRGYLSKYKKLSPDGKSGNYYVTDDSTNILRVVKFVNEKRPDIKNLIIDDFGYVITNQYMRKAMQKGYDKYVEIGSSAFNILEAISNIRDDLFCIVTMHTEIDMHGKYKPKTIGKMIDNTINIEGKFTYVFHALRTDSGYQFLTNFDGQHVAKTPLGLFEDSLIDNDLNEIIELIKAYNAGE